MEGSLYELFYFLLCSSRHTKYFLQLFIKVMSGIVAKIFHIFRSVEGSFHGTPKRVYHPLKFLGVFPDILVTASRLNTLHGLWRQYHLYWRSYEITLYQTCCQNLMFSYLRRNVAIALKLCRLLDLIVAIICTNFWEFFDVFLLFGA